MFKIERGWEHSEIDKIYFLYKRPRVDYRISEYVVDYIDKTILRPRNIMQRWDYDIGFTFGFYYGRSEYHKDTVYCTENKTYKVIALFNRKETGLKNKCIDIFGRSIELTEKIQPKEYANIVYDMMGVFLTSRYKKITKETMDNNKKGIDYEYIEQFKFPAVFENQKYDTDDAENFILNTEDRTLIPFDIKKEYKKYYGEE